MTDTTPSEELSQDLRRLVDEGSAVRAMTSAEQAELWQGIVGRAKRPHHPLRRLFLVGASGIAVVGALVLWRLGPGTARISPPVVAPGLATQTASTASAGGLPLSLPSEARRVQLGSRIALGLWPEAQVTLPPQASADQHGVYRMRLERGRIVAAVAPRGTDEPLSVVTPQLRVVVVGTRFSVEVDHDLTSVAVTEGRVRIEGGGHVVFLSAGESIRSDDERLSGKPAPFPCADRTAIADQRACLTRSSAGAGLAAENALYALALLERDRGGAPERALLALREYQHRFPHGALAPEVALTLADMLSALGRRREACAEAKSSALHSAYDATTRDRLRRFCDR